MKLWLLLIVSLISLTALSQTKNDLIGNWKVVQVLVPAELRKNKEATLQIEKTFQCRFQFNNDGTCKAIIPHEDFHFKNFRWSYNEKEKSISIDGQDDEGKKGSIIKLLVSSKNNKWYFDIFETPVSLEVQKVAGTN